MRMGSPGKLVGAAFAKNSACLRPKSLVPSFPLIMPNYYIVWMKDVIDSNSIYMPILYPNSHTVTQYVATQFTDTNLACGLAHEIWKPDRMLEAPKPDLVSRYIKLVTETFEDTLEESFIAISQDCRGVYGYNCSIHQLFSGSELCPSSTGIKKNLLADIVNVVQDGLLSELKPAAQERLLKELLRIEPFFSPTSFQNQKAVLLIAQLYALSFAYAGEAERAIDLADDTAKEFGLSMQDRESIISLGASVDALKGLHDLSNSLVAMRSQPRYPKPFTPPRVTPIGPPLSDEELMARGSQAANRLYEYDKKAKQARIAQIIVWSTSLLFTLAGMFVLLYPFDKGLFSGGLDGEEIVIVVTIPLICTFLVGGVPSLICNAIFYPKGRRPLW